MTRPATFRPRLRPVAVATAAMTLATVGLAAGASAAVTSSSISSTNYASAYSLFTGTQSQLTMSPPTLQLAGSYTGSGGVDADCYTGDAASVVGSQASPAAGQFRVSGDVPFGKACDLRAVPTGTTPTGTTAQSFAPRRSDFEEAVTTSEQDATPGTPVPGVNSARAVHVHAVLPQSGALDAVGDAVAAGSAPTGGLSTSLFDSSLASGGSDVFDGAALLPSDGATPGTQLGGVRVDGVNALTPGAAATIWGADPSQPDFLGSVTTSATADPATGDTVVSTSEPLIRCADPTLPATTARCSSFQLTGVTLSRTVSTSQSGRLVSVRDQWSSAAAHTLALDYEHTVGSSSSTGPVFSVDDGATYTSAPAGTSLTLPAAPGTVYVRTSSATASFAHPAGSLTYSTAPDSATTLSGGTLVTHYNRSIPANGALTLTQSYVSSDSATEVSTLSQAARSAAYAPTLTLAPVPATVSARSLTLSGIVTAGQNGLPATVTTTDGHSAAVDPRNGAFSVVETLTPGLQALGVSATDSAGQTASQSVLVSYDNPLTVGRLDGFLLYSNKLIKVRRTVGRHVVVTKVPVRYVSGLRMRVPLHCSSQATSICKATLQLTSGGRKVGAATVKYGPGYRPTVTIPLTRAGVAAWNAAHFPKPTRAHPHPRGHGYPVKVTVTYYDPDGTAYPHPGASSLSI